MGKKGRGCGGRGNINVIKLGPVINLVEGVRLPFQILSKLGKLCVVKISFILHFRVKN